MKLVKCSNCDEKFDPSKVDRCPECGTHYQPRQQRATSAPQPHPLGYPQCDWRSSGERCSYPGTMSTNQKGEPPFFCSAHFDCSDPILGADIVERSRSYQHANQRDNRPEIPAAFRKLSVEQCRSMIKSMAREIGKREPSTAWAQRIMDGIARGEKLGSYPEKLAREALAQVSTREPGQDETEAAWQP